MSFIGRPHISGAVLVWDGEKLISEAANSFLQNALGNTSGQIALSGPISYAGNPQAAEPKIELIHRSPFNSDEGLIATIDPNASEDWIPFASYDINGDKVYEAGTDTGASWVAVTSTDPDGNSGYQFMNELGTFIALDTTGQLSSLVFQKADNGYIDFTGDATGDPILRINTADKTLSVNGLDITPRSGSMTVPAASNANHTILDLSSYVSNDQYATFDINVFATTKGMQSYNNIAVSSWKFFVSMYKANDVVKVGGITEYDQQYSSGSNATDNPPNWNVELNTNGILFVNAQAPTYDLAFGAIITKLSVLDISTGNIIK